MIFSIFRFLHPRIPDFKIVVSRPNIILTNYTSMERLFIQHSDDVYISIKKKLTIIIKSSFIGYFELGGGGPKP